jgi:hypothetical protein
VEMRACSTAGAALGRYGAHAATCPAGDPGGRQGIGIVAGRLYYLRPRRAEAGVVMVLHAG